MSNESKPPRQDRPANHPSREQTKDLLLEVLNGMCGEVKLPPKNVADQPRKKSLIN